MTTRKIRMYSPLAVAVAAALFVQGSAIRAQETAPSTNVVAPRPAFRQNAQPIHTSELARDNYNRVAASSADIRVVLARDAGLLVELKRWVAKEATDNGQVVEDSDLTDQAIFDRLDRDVTFRSLATRLLQRYGYLTPATNPESELGKEQDLFQKERVRRLVALENQQDAASPPQERRAAPETERVMLCDPRQGDACDRDNRTLYPSGSPSPNTAPSSEPESIPLETVPDFSSSPTRTMRAGSDNPVTGPRLPASSTGEASLVPSSLTSGHEIANSSPAPNPLAPGRRSDFPSGGTLNEINSIDRTANSLSAPAGSRRSLPSRRTLPDPSDDDVTPVKMVRPTNPYSDVPSLYDMYVQAAAWQRPAQVFGLEIFRNSLNQPETTPMDLPIGPDYVVGPGDSLSVDLWGGISQRLVRAVDRQGRISLPEAGPLLVSGKTIADVQSAVEHALRTQFRNVSADVSVARLHTVRVYVVGDVVAPGAYDISSLSTPLNAVFAAGGITARGSLRKLQHYRGQQLIQQVDAYDLLLHGIRTDLKQLQSGDSLLVPSVGPQITVDGMVRRPAIYELLNESSLADVLSLAGGILPTAALRHIEVQRLEAHEKRTMFSVEVSSAEGDPGITRQLQSFKTQAGDQVHIFPMASYNEESIYLQGHVLRQGKYSYKPGMKLTDIISSYADLLPEPALHYVEVIRLNPPDYRPSVESFDLAEALAKPATSPALKPLDTVRVFSRYAFEPPPDVWVGGEVHAPGNYRTSGQAHLLDALYLAGGLSRDASLSSAQLFRTHADGTIKIMSVDLRKVLAGDPSENVLLESRDRILVHRNAAQVDPATVYVKGEVAKPGRYPLASNMRVEDLIRVAGGLRRSADTDLADLTRFAAADSTGTGERAEIKLSAVMSGDQNENVSLRDGDVLTVRQVPQWNDLGSSVIVRGEVQHPATYGIEPGEKLSSVMKRAGGLTPQAYPYGAVLLRREVRELQMKAHLELVERIKAEQTYLRSLPEADLDQKNAKANALAQSQTALYQVQTTAPTGRLVIHIPSHVKNVDSFAKSSADIQLRNGDELIIPKKANYVTVGGQVYNPTAVSYLPGKSAKWYLSQAGGLTQLADKGAVFVIRADGSVLGAKNNSSFWSGDPMGEVLKPGDSVVVPEKALKVAGRNWTPILQAAQVASSVALTVAYIHP